MNRPYNFSAGPAALPEAVLKRAQEEMLDWQGSGMSVMEMSHRGKHFSAIAAQTEADLRELLGVPDDYRVLFLQGGATSQFAMVPLNLLGGKPTADYLNTGQWSAKAIKEAGRYCQVNVAASGEESGFSAIPERTEWQLNPDAAYCHYTPNETIGGVEFHAAPEVDTPLVADMSSTILSRPIEVTQFGLIYAGAQKNIGPSGLTVVIVRDDWLRATEPLPSTPTMFDYRVHAAAGSMSNTPPTYAWYIAGLTLQWLKDQGGLAAMARRNQAKAELLYSAIENSDFYRCPVAADCRSWMNVPFTLADPNQDAAFLAAAEAAGLLALKGHRSVGGMRASLYNAMPIEGVQALVDFMAEFERGR